MSRLICLGTFLVLCGSAEASGPTLKLAETSEPRFLLKRELPPYRNFAFDLYKNYPNHTYPYEDAPRVLYGSLGHEQIVGYPWYDWREIRMPGQTCDGQRGEQCGSVIDWPCTTCQMTGSDYSGNWGYSGIIGLTGALRFTPLILSRTYSRGFRLDFASPLVQATAHAARGEHVHGIKVENSTFFLANRVQFQLGIVQLGLNWINLHQFQSTRPGNSIHGRLRSFQPLVDWIVVQFKDDSPEDGRGGATIQKVTLYLDGEPRPDIEPIIIRHRADVNTQVGRTLRTDNSFRPTNYAQVTGQFYGDDEMPLFADYLYRIDHERGMDVSGFTNLKGLLSNFTIESAGQVLNADGDSRLVYLYEVRNEPSIKTASVEALVANDYHIAATTISEVSPKSRDYFSRYWATFFRDVLRARGNVRDGTNIGTVRFRIGEQTAHFSYGADASFRLPGLEINAEYARSARHFRYPTHANRKPAFDKAPRFAERGGAYFVNGIHWFEGGLVGGEYFAINPDYVTEMRQYMDPVISTYSPQHRLWKWLLVEDNEEADIWPDILLVGYDLDGVFPNQDQDQNGIPDIDRDFDGIPDFEEPFLMFDVVPNEFTYGLDRNHNDEPDLREDDWKEDYPYDYDHRGYHFFGQLELTKHWTLAAGRFSARQIAGHRSNRSTYTILGYRRDGFGVLRHLFFENNARIVRDDVPDLYLSVVDPPQRSRLSGFSRRTNISEPRQDPLRYKNSYVNESYIEAEIKLWESVKLTEQLRLRLNWQRGDNFASGFAEPKRLLNLWTVVSSVEYKHYWRRLTITPQFKFLLLRETDRTFDRSINSEYRVVPIVRVELPLMRRTRLQGGVQGFGRFPYRLKDEAEKRNSLKRYTSFVNIVNTASYFGYDLNIIMGVYKDHLEFDDPLLENAEFDRLDFSIRAYVGFPAYGRTVQ